MAEKVQKKSKTRKFKRGDVVEVVWDDAYSLQDVWIAASQLEEHLEPITIKTVGQYLEARDGYVYLSLCQYGEDDTFAAGGVWGIPRGFVKSIRKVGK